MFSLITAFVSRLFSKMKCNLKSLYKLLNWNLFCIQMILLYVFDYSLDENKFEVYSLTSLTFSAAIYELFGIHIGYTLELIESHFLIRPPGSDHSLVRIAPIS
jgi:hypothetical protein